MNDEMPSTLQHFLDLTEKTYTSLTSPVQLFTDNQRIETLLETWSQKLCFLLSQYTRSGNKPVSDRRTLRSITRICPWRMTSQQTNKCKYLATLCILYACCDSLLDYTVDRQSDTSQQYLVPNALQESMDLKQTLVPDSTSDKLSLDGLDAALHSKGHDPSSVVSTDCSLSPSSFTSEKVTVCSAPTITEDEDQNTSANIASTDITSTTTSESTSATTSTNTSATTSTNTTAATSTTTTAATSTVTKLSSSLTNDYQAASPHCSIDDSTNHSPLTNDNHSLTQHDSSLADETLKESLADDGIYPTSLAIVCQFVSTFWFLVNQKELCSYIEKLSADKKESEKQKYLWITLMNCLVGKSMCWSSLEP